MLPPEIRPSLTGVSLFTGASTPPCNLRRCRDRSAEADWLRAVDWSNRLQLRDRADLLFVDLYSVSICRSARLPFVGIAGVMTVATSLCQEVARPNDS